MARRTTQLQNHHDTAVRLLAAHWRDPVRYNIATNPDGQQNRWAGRSDLFPDIIAWSRQGERDVALWIVEVETGDSVTEVEARGQWANYAATGIPLSLAVPMGSGSTAWQVAQRLGIAVQRVFEHSVIGGRLQIVEAPAPAQFRQSHPSR